MEGVDPLEVAFEQLGYRESSGLVEGTSAGPVARSFVWRELEKKTGVDATYFRGAVPLVAFLRADTESEIKHVQRRLWNLSRVPLLIASTSQRLVAYSCVETPPGEQTDLLELASSRHGLDLRASFDDFSRESVESGVPGRRRPSAFNRRSRVDVSLLDNLRRLRTKLHGTERRQGIDALIGRAMFVRYLEDRGVLTRDHLYELVHQRSFVAALASGATATYGLFGQLADRFNGDVFAIAPGERDVVTDDDVAAVSAFLDGTDLSSQQGRLWPYDFSAIPPELISSIYEQLLEETRDEDAAYYTPRHVVDLILDEVLPWSAGSADAPRILDPACGSGVFLTESFRRIAFGMSVASDRAPSLGDLTSAMTRSVWGIDRSAEAVRVSAFGLYLALLEEVDPPTTWDSARLPQLAGKNLVIADCFDDHVLAGETFDLVVGNPPWKSQLTPAAESYLTKSKHPIANRQIAQLFVWRAIESLRPEGRVALLLPAKSLLHNRSPRATAVRREMFEAMDLETVIDLSVLRHSTFSDAIAPAAVLIGKKYDRDLPGHGVVHVSPKTGTTSAGVDVFTITQLDIQEIASGIAVMTDDIWKSLLWGDAGDLDLIARLRASHPSLGDVAKEHSWKHGRGFELSGDRNPSGSLRGMRFIATELVTPFKIQRAPREVVTARYMHRPRSPALYQAPMVLVRRGLVDGRIAAAYVGSPAAFNNGLFGISGPARDRDLLRAVAACLNSSLSHYYQFLTSASWGVERDFVEASEHLSLPIPMPSERVLKRLLEAVHALERGPVTPAASRRLDQAVLSAYGLSKADGQRVRDRLTYRLDQFRLGPLSHAAHPVSAAGMASYSSTVVTTLASVAPEVAVEVTSSRVEQYGVVEVRLGNVPGIDSARPSVEAVLRDLERRAIGWPSTVTIFVPAGITVRGDTAIVVKPLDSVNWSATAALADVSEVLGALASGRIDEVSAQYAVTQ